jgi:uncharacterized surface protein with fasciclin (FAS1) repeats
MRSSGSLSAEATSMNVTRRSPSPSRHHRCFPLMAFLAGVFLLSGCGESPETSPRDTASNADGARQNTIVDVAAVAGQFSTLLTAVEAAGLTETLRDDGPFTVFAPTDGAFAELPDGLVDELLEDPDALAQILLYHVVPGEYTVRDLREISELETVEGSMLRIDDQARGLTVNGATMLTSDIRAANGIVHVLTTVLVPGS